ncbi:MAG: S9 family peptidase [Pseudomonadota bacterium]
MPNRTFSLRHLVLCALPVLASAQLTLMTAQSNAEELTIDRLHAQPGLSGPSLRGAKISPNGRLVTVLRGRADNASQLDLWAYDSETGEDRMLVSSTDLTGGASALSEEEKNRRERQRIYASGIISYQWDKQGTRILFPLGGDIFVYNLTTDDALRTTATDTFETDAKFSPQGRYVSYVRDDEVYVFDLDKEKEKRITKGASATVRNGVSEFVAQEELDRFTGYWWSPNDDLIAYTKIDESPVPIAERVDINADEIVTIRQRYPFAGSNNVTIRLGVTDVKGRRTKWIDLGDDPDIYLADAYWSQDGSTLYVARLTRDQKRLDLLAANPRTGETRVLFTESADTWVNLGLGLTPLSDGGFLWSSERGGTQQLYRYDADGNAQGAVTAGGVVTKLNCVDEDKGQLFFTGWQESALERHVYRKSLTGRDGPRPLTDQAGWHSANFAGNCDGFILSHSSPNQPRQASFHSQDGTRQFWLLENRLDNDHPYSPFVDSHVTPTYGQLTTEDGTALDYMMMKPAGLRAGDTAPAIQLVYGGPHAQRVAKRWGGLLAQALVDQGYVVFQLDNRGAGNRGTAFENTLYRAMGVTEVADQALATRWLADQPFVDGDRIGVYGWSYGGYMTLHMLMQNPDLYAGGVSGAPVTDWRFYDTAYTERYMGDPVADKDAYDASAVFAHTDKLADPLLIIHGMADDNVIFQNTVKLIDDLQKKGKTFELMTYPGEKHGFRATTARKHRDQMIVDFFNRTLQTP